MNFNFKKILLFIISACSLCNSEATEQLNETDNNFRRVYILKSDDNYIQQTAVAIKTVQLTDDSPKTFILFSDGVKQPNLEKLNSMIKGNDELIIEDVYNEKYTSFMNKYQTTWNRLTTLQIIFPNILKNIKINSGKDHIKKCLHLDGDLFVLKNLDELWSMQYNPENPNHFLFGADIGMINLENLIDEELGIAMSAGVVLWHLEDLYKDERFKNGQNEFYSTLCKEIELRQCVTSKKYCELLCKILKLDNYNEKIEELINNLDRRSELSFDNKGIDSLIQNLITSFPNAFKENNDKKHLLELVKEHLNDTNSIFHPEKRDTTELERKRIRDYIPLEEDIFLDFCKIIDTKFNFIAKYIYPELDKTPQTNYEYFQEETGEIIDYPGLLSKCLEFESIRNQLHNAVQDIKILHFDVTEKPWSANEKELLKSNQQKYKLFQFYYDILKTTPFSTEEHDTTPQPDITPQEYKEKADQLQKQLQTDFEEMLKEITIVK